MERIYIPHSDDFAAGTWTLESGCPVHRCPKCKRAGRMLNHSIDADGTVNASIACWAPCDYHIWGILDGWTHGVKEAGKLIVVNQGRY